jgi:predicted KAP-like P-loop ATPase
MPDEQIPIDFASDRPIERIQQDKLGRQFFARKTAEAIARRRGRESFVVALQGAWGCGKSSIKNMVIEALEELSPTTAVVDFAPWQLRDADILFAAFFDEIALAIGQSGDGNEERKKQLSSYGKHLTLGGSALKSLGTLGGVVGVPGAKILELLGNGLGDSAKIALEGADALGEKSLKQLKNELKESLRSLDCSILVVIDDIDRLDIKEMLLIFQLVKANADFPNFTYLLLLQRDVVESALAKEVGEQGRDYLDKIIQLPIDVPPISDAQRRQLLLEGLVEVCGSWNLPLSAEQTRELDLLWSNGLKGMLQYPRDVRRLLNALEFSGALMQGTAGWEVNLADFTALETLRVQEPKTYSRLASLKPLLTGPRPSTTQDISKRFGIENNRGDLEKEADQPGRAEMDALLELLSSDRRDAARAMLAFVFPQANWAFITSEEARYRTAQARRELGVRAAETRYFDRYFALSIPTDQISEAEIARAITLTGNIEEFKLYLRRFQDKQLLWLLVIELKDRIKLIPEESFPALLTTLLDFGEEMPPEFGLGGDFLETALGWLFGDVLKRREDVSERGQLFSGALDACQALRLPVRWIWDEEVRNRDSRFATRTDAWATEAQLAQFHTQITERIAEAAFQSRLEEHPQVQMLARFWAETQQTNLVQWLARKMQDEAGLRFFLDKFSQKSYVVSASPTLEDISFQSDVLAWIVDLSDVKERVAALDKTNWSQIDKITAERFAQFAERALAQRTQASSSETGDA